jgi:hypothetical protein
MIVMLSRIGIETTDHKETTMPTKINTKKAVWTLFAIFCSLLVLFIMLYVITPVISRLFMLQFHLKDLTAFLIVDAIISFGICVTVFLVLLSIERIYSIFVVVFCVVFLFLFWGFESSFFWKGFSSMYPLWYEVNMALNDTVAAIVAIFIYIYFLSSRNHQGSRSAHIVDK